MKSEQKAFVISILIIAVAGFVVYANSFKGEFIWDDDYLVKDNEYLRSWSNLPKVFTTDLGAGGGKVYGFYRPLQIITYMVDYALWGMNEKGYHLTNVLVHVLVALVIYWLINLLYGDKLLSLFTGLFFVIHPVHTEAVSYVSGRADPLSALFMLLTFILYLKSLRLNTIRVYLLLLFVYILAFLSRENSLMLPALILLYHYVFKKPLPRRQYFSLLGVALVYIVLRITLLKFLFKTLSANITYSTTLLQRAPGFFAALATYLRLLVFPVNLHMEYGNVLFPLINPRVIAGMALLAGLLAASYRFRKGGGVIPVFFSCSWFLAALLPASNLYPLNAYMAEHWLYLPSLGFFLLLAASLRSLYRNKDYRFLGLILAVALFLFFFYLTIKQNNYWAKPVTFYKRTLAFTPGSARLHHNLGLSYYNLGRYEEAVAAYQKAVEIDPGHGEAYNNLGCAYNDLGRPEEAIAAYEQAVRINPHNAKAYNNLGVAYYTLGRNEEAIAAYRKAIDNDPAFVEPYSNLAAAYAGIGRIDDAIALLERSVEINPGQGAAYYNLGVVYQNTGKKESALAAYRKAIEADPGYIDAYCNLGALYNEMERSEEAVALLKRALTINPDHPLAHNNLAVAYYHIGQYRLAAWHCDRAIALGLQVHPDLYRALAPYR